MRIRLCLISISAFLMISFAADASAQQLTRDIKVISSAGARALVDQCAAWAEKNKQVVAIAIRDWGGNLIESHAMEGAPANAIDTALLKAKSALAPRHVRNKQACPQWPKSGADVHAGFSPARRAADHY